MLKEILNHLDSIIYISSLEDYSLIYINKAGKDIIGIDQEDESYCGKKCYQILQGNEEPCTFCTNSLLRKGEFYEWENYNSLVKEYFFNKDTLFEYEGKKLRLEIADKATKRVEERKSLINMLETETALIQCVHTLAEFTDLQKAVEKILCVIGEFYNGDRAYIFEINYEEKLFSNTYEWCKEDISNEIDKLQCIPIKYIDSWLEEFQKRGEFYLSRLTQCYVEGTNEYNILKEQGIDSLVTAPLLTAGKIIGFIGVDNPRRNVEEVELLRSVTYFIINDLEKRKYISALKHISYMDTLTGVFNRNRYNEIMKELQEERPRELGLIYADINGLKEANDSLGHAYGDQLIVTLAKLLKECFVSNICRIGGDEFVVFCIHMEQSEFDQKLVQFLEKLNSEESISVSVGSSYSCENSDVGQLISLADQQMYQNKSQYYLYKEKKQKYSSVTVTV